MNVKLLKNKYIGKRAFMIGNGPSLNKTPLDALQNEYSFAMNRISLIYDKVKWRPSFFICTTLNIEREEWRKDIIKTMLLGIPCFVWDKLKGYIEPYNFKNIYYINCTHGEKVSDKGEDSWWSFDINEHVCKFGTSMLPALQIASYMGFNPIYLLGCDLGFQPNRTETNHFNSTINKHNQISDDPNHFNPNYGTPGCPPDVLNMNMTAAHHLAFRSTSRIGVDIYNATIDGHLSVYPRVNLSEIINIKAPMSEVAKKNERSINSNLELRDSTQISTKNTPIKNSDDQINRIINKSLIGTPLKSYSTKSSAENVFTNVARNPVKINIIDIGSAGSMPEPWKNHKTVIGKRLAFEPRVSENDGENSISISATLWKKNEERNFYIYRGLNGSGSSLFLQNYDFVLENFNSLKNIGSKTLANTWLERSLPIEVKRVTCETLDNVLQKINLKDKFHFIKIDAQGAEYQILQGSQNYLINDCYGMQLELFTLPMYRDIKLYEEVVAYLNSLGFDLIKKFAPHGTFNSQCDCVFLRRDIEDDITKKIRKIYGLFEWKNSNPGSQRLSSHKIRWGEAVYDYDKNKGSLSQMDSLSAASPKYLLSSETTLQASNQLLREYKDKHQGQRCIIIGNGPSLNKMDLTFLKREITFGLNKIYLLFDKWDFTSTYYVSVNPLVLKQNAKEISSISSPKFLSINGREFLSSKNEIIFLKSIGTPSFSKDPGHGVWEGHTVTYVAMQLAFYMGFDEVILIGVDHSYDYSGNPNQEVVSEGEDFNHFHPEYFGKGTRWNLPDLRKSEIAYRMAKKEYESNGRRIVDATVAGKLKIFQKCNYQKLLKKYSIIDKEMKKTNCSEVSYLRDTSIEQLNSGDIDNALISTKEIIKFNPNDALSHHYLGVIYQKKSDLNKAVIHYEKASALQPKNIDFRKALANFYYSKTRRIGDAIEQYCKIIEVDPEDLETLLALGHISLQMKKIDEAKVFYKKVLEVDPFNKDAILRLNDIKNLTKFISVPRFSAEL